MPNGFFYFKTFGRFTSNRRSYLELCTPLTVSPNNIGNEDDFGYVLLKPWVIEISVLNANSVDPDQTPRSAAFDLDLHCLLISIFWIRGINGLNFCVTRKMSSETIRASVSDR